jgi:hypothetical protein
MDDKEPTLRDVFAIAAMQTMLKMEQYQLASSTEGIEELATFINKVTSTVIASRAYLIADAMIKAREK